MKFIDSRCTQHIKDEGELVVAKNAEKLETLISTIFLFSFLPLLVKKRSRWRNGAGKGDEKRGKARGRTNLSPEKGVFHSTSLRVYIPLTIRRLTWCTF